MRPLSWKEYYENFDNWAESTREQYVSRLSSVGSHDEVAAIVNSIYTERIASRLLTMALDAGVKFSSSDISLMEFSVDTDTLSHAKKTVDARAERKARKKANREAFWEGAGEVMLIDSTIAALFGRDKDKDR